MQKDERGVDVGKMPREYEGKHETGQSGPGTSVAQSG